MPPEVTTVGLDWLVERVEEMPESIDRIGPVEFNEQNRYLPQGVSPRSGFIRYDLFPFLREVIECFDPMSPVREVNFLKGVQVGYTTLLESILLYYVGQIKTAGVLYITADKELATARIDNNIMPMINESDMGHLIQSSDVENTRKTGKTANLVQWDGGGFLVPHGAQNAAKMRQLSVPLILKDELDGWKREVGKDGNADVLTDARASAYWSVRKILRGSTPLLYPSMIFEAYERGDQRKYKVLCKACSYPQELRWRQTVDEETGLVSGFFWDLDDHGRLILESVRYCCQKCGHEHYEHDKERLFSEEYGAHWQPTAEPREPGIRSYHLPSLYSPFGFRPWYKAVSDFLEAFDPETKTVRNIGKFQEFYNNTLGRPFEVMGNRIRFTAVSAHRRAVYRRGEIPNQYARQYSGGPVVLLTCQVDVHKRNLAVTVMGWTVGACCYVIDYERLEPGEKETADCTELSCSAWGRLRQIIEERRYTADDGRVYPVGFTLIDAGYENATVTAFCGDYSANVYPILGRDRPAKAQRIREFDRFETKAGTVGYRILVDHYKDRLAPVLRREWHEEHGIQNAYHFNAPVDFTDDELKELTREYRREKKDSRGHVSYEWHRPGNAEQALWDLLVYGSCAVEIIAYRLCIEHFEMDTVDWPRFWEYLETEALFFDKP